MRSDRFAARGPAEETGVSCGCDVHSLSSPFRVQYRADMLQERKEREARELERQKEEQERQNRLVEALRKQVNH